MFYFLYLFLSIYSCLFHFFYILFRQLGINDIFDDTATLTGIAQTKRTSEHLKVTDILQKAGIEVNENGTAAYVATGKLSVTGLFLLSY